MIKELLKRGIIGAAIGVFINQIIFVIISSFYGFSGTVDVRMMVNNFVIASLLGFAIAAASIVFSIENWSVLKKTIIHFIIMSAAYFPASVLGNWMPENISGKVGYVIVFALIYVLIWFAYKIYWTKKISELNKQLESKH